MRFFYNNSDIIRIIFINLLPKLYLPTKLYSLLMRKALLLFFLTVSGVSVAVANDYFALAARFDNLEVGY